jgi:hypothetical protein
LTSGSPSSKALIAKRQDIDEQLAALFNGAIPPKKTRRCKPGRL